MSEITARDSVLELPTHELIAMKHAIEIELENRDVCEHGIKDGNWCPYCNAEMKRAAKEQEGMP